MNYRRKPEIVQAVQWDGSEEALEAIQEINCGASKVRGESFLTIPRALMSIIYLGDWLVDYDEVLSDATFRAKYEPFTEPEKCKWTSDGGLPTWNWFAECGFEHSFYDLSPVCDTPKESGFKYCPNCGREIEERA